MSVENIIENASASVDGWPKFSVTLDLADVRHEKERQIYTIFTMLGDIGGFNSAIIIFPAFFMAHYSGLMY